MRLFLSLSFLSLAILAWALISHASHNDCGGFCREVKVPVMPKIEASAANTTDVAALMEQSKAALKEWNTYRDQVYLFLGLTNDDLARLEAIRANFSASIDEIATKLQQASGGDKDQLISALNAKGAEYDVAIRSLIGRGNFEYLVQSKEAFNAELTRTGAKIATITHSW